MRRHLPEIVQSLDIDAPPFLTLPCVINRDSGVQRQHPGSSFDGGATKQLKPSRHGRFRRRNYPELSNLRQREPLQLVDCGFDNWLRNTVFNARKLLVEYHVGVHIQPLRESSL